MRVCFGCTLFQVGLNKNQNEISHFRVLPESSTSLEGVVRAEAASMIVSKLL